MKQNKLDSQLILDRFEGDKAVILDGKDEIILPKRLLPKGIKEGDAVVISVFTDREETKNREKTAKELLNEILNGK